MPASISSRILSRVLDPSNLRALDKNMMEFSAELQKRSKSAFLVWLILTACSALFGLLPFISSEAPANAETSADALVRVQDVLSILAVLMATSSAFLRFYLFSETRLKAFVAQIAKPPLDDQTRAAALMKLSAQWFMFNIIAWGLNESIASIGLMVATMARKPTAVLPFVGVSVLLNLSMKPDLRETARKAGLVNQ